MFSRRRPITWALLGLLVVGGLAQTAQAAEAPVLDRIVKSGKLRVATSGNQPPYNATNRSGELMGLEIDLARVLAGALGVEVEFVTKPFPELMATLESGEADVVMSGMSITPERNLKAIFVGPYTLSGKSILTKSKTLAAAEAAGEINRAEVKLVALENSTSQTFVEALLADAQLTTTKDYDAAVQMVLDGTADAMVADMPACVLAVLRHPEHDLATLTQPLTIEPIGVAMAPGDPQFQNLIDNYLTAVEASGLLQALSEKWLKDGSWVAALP